MRTILRAIPALVLFTSASFAQPGDPCEWLLRYGIHDKEHVASNRYAFEHLKSLLKHSQARTLQQFKEETASAGAGGLFSDLFFDVEVSGKRASSNFDDWKAEVLKTESFDRIENESFKREFSGISSRLIDAVEKCLETHHPGLRIWVVPSRDDLTFSLHIRYTKYRDESAVFIAPLQFTPKEFVEPLSSDLSAMVSAGRQVGNVGGGTVVTFRRRDIAHGFTVTVNTDYGGWPIAIPPAYHDPDIAYEREIHELEQKLWEEQKDRAYAEGDEGVASLGAFSNRIEVVWPRFIPPEGADLVRYDFWPTETLDPLPTGRPEDSRWFLKLPPNQTTFIDGGVPPSGPAPGRLYYYWIRPRWSMPGSPNRSDAEGLWHRLLGPFPGRTRDRELMHTPELLWEKQRASAYERGDLVTASQGCFAQFIRLSWRPFHPDMPRPPDKYGVRRLNVDGSENNWWSVGNTLSFEDYGSDMPGGLQTTTHYHYTVIAYWFIRPEDRIGWDGYLDAEGYINKRLIPEVVTGSVKR